MNLAIRGWAIVVAFAVSARAQDEKPKYPPYTVTVRAKTKFMSARKAGGLQTRLNQIRVYAQQVGRSPEANDNAGWERWSFQIAGESKFDISILQRAFGDVQCGKWELTITGSAVQDPQTKIIYVTSYGGKVKVKLMNRPKKESNPDEKVEDVVGKVSEEIFAGKMNFTVTGEIYSHGGTLALLLSHFSPAPPPPPEPKDDKRK